MPTSTCSPTCMHSIDDWKFNEVCSVFYCKCGIVRTETAMKATYEAAKASSIQQDNQTTTEPANELHTPITFGSFKNPYDVVIDQEDTSPSTKEDVTTERPDVSNESGDDWTKVVRKNTEQPRKALGEP